MINKIRQHKVARTCLRNTRIQVYCALIIACSLISVPEDYKMDKTNVLNQWFVKLGWFWTCILVVPLLFFNIQDNDREAVSYAMFRILLSTLLWYISVTLFQFVDTTTGFDISGHTFLLIFSNLLITSELELSNTSEFSNKRCSNNMKVKQKSAITNLKISPKMVKIPLFILTILWDFMLLQTALYYHTILQKTIAALWAIGSWYVLHIFFYDKAQKIERRNHLPVA